MRRAMPHDPLRADGVDAGKVGKAMEDRDARAGEHHYGQGLREDNDRKEAENDRLRGLLTRVSSVIERDVREHIGGALELAQEIDAELEGRG